ncbi:sigma-70 family RNA polymerase sigma factor [Radiobacillus kanasensis]|uniref:sigma-70 family RNA polymerase sigma factor n=1 Tax=Radiobacillus kanasensis TaxID=2844358 RepID=UPI001E4658BF|nr:sigma-70 family RNA polymerase sigma factor [Radiobacillus kanasensis]UFT98523.1 sigma-70 family RNA polymerase sigma factor [Radiobacillus kanasensis]
MSNSQDMELVKKAKEGDVQAYSDLVVKYSNAIYGTALSMTRDNHAAQDIAQEAFVKAWSSLSTIKDSRKFSSWLYMITKRLSLDLLRKSKPYEDIDQHPHLFDHSEKVDVIVQRKFEKKSVWDAIYKLDEKNRQVIILYYISGFSAREISSFLDVSTRAVESRIRRSKGLLQKELLPVMEKELSENKVGKKFHEDVLWRIVPRIATIEIPVSQLQKAIDWYNKILGTKVGYQDSNTAMIYLQGGQRIGVPTIYLVETESKERLTFINTKNNIAHSVIDFYVEDLDRFHQFLKHDGVEVTDINLIPGQEGKGGFGFKDLDGNSLSACNVTFRGQV